MACDLLLCCAAPKRGGPQIVAPNVVSKRRHKTYTYTLRETVMHINKQSLRLIALSAAVTAAFAAPVHATPVALELALLIDVSSSVSNAEYNLQKTGYINAFNNALIQSNIGALTGGIAVTYIEWSSGGQQSQLVGWTQITDAASSSAFATAIQGTSRAFNGSTGPGSAINFAAPLFASNAFEGGRWVIDVSGDGMENSGADTSDARDAFLAGAPVPAAVNGLCIGGTDLCSWYSSNVVGGTNAFVVQASTFEDFGNAVVSKIGREISNGVPVPATAALLGIGMMAAGLTRRRKSA